MTPALSGSDRSVSESPRLVLTRIQTLPHTNTVSTIVLQNLISFGVKYGESPFAPCVTPCYKVTSETPNSNPQIENGTTTQRVLVHLRGLNDTHGNDQERRQPSRHSWNTRARQSAQRLSVSRSLWHAGSATRTDVQNAWC